MWRKFVQDYLSFTRQERRGIVVLCSLILVCWCIPPLTKYFRKNIPEDFSSFQKEVALFHRQEDSLQQLQRHAHQAKSMLSGDALPEPFLFDPNTLSETGWLNLGVPAREITIIRHYLEAGGRFYRKEDLQKIYGFPHAMYKRLAPYIRIPQEKQAHAKSKPPAGKAIHDKDAAYTRPAKGLHSPKTFTLDINKADSLDWVKLRGIGPVLSSRIIRFREALGGFYSKDQLSEVFGLPDSTLRQIKQQLKFSGVALKKLNINTATVDELQSHPYISYRIALSIKAFRDLHGPYDSVEGLKQLQLVDDQIYRKLAPYLTVK